MITIWKFHLPLGRQDIEMPAGAEILHVDAQGGQVYLWARLHSENPLKEMRTFVVTGTGHEAPGQSYSDYIGTVQSMGLVWHAFEIINKSAEKTLTYAAVS